MRLPLIILMIVAWTSSRGQLCSIYTMKGVAAMTAERVRFKSQIVLRPDSSFLWISESYDYHNNTLISADTSVGRWTRDKRVLKLDHSPRTTSQDEEEDTYIIKNRKLKRTAFRSKWSRYRGFGILLKKERMD